MDFILAKIQRYNIDNIILLFNNCFYALYI